MHRKVFQLRLLIGALLFWLPVMSGCAGFGSEWPGQSHELHVTGRNSDGANFELRVIDTANIVADARSLSRPGGLSDGGVQLDTDGRGVLVWWPGLPCEDHPSVEVGSRSDTLTIEIDNGPRRGEVCPHSEVQFTVRLSFKLAFAAAELG